VIEPTEKEVDKFKDEIWWESREKILKRLPHTCTKEECEVTSYNLTQAVEKHGIRVIRDNDGNPKGYIQSRCKKHRS